MSDEREASEETSAAAAEAEASSAVDQPKDLPVPLVVVVMTIAVLVFGTIGWKHYQTLKAETERTFDAAAKQRAFQQGQADARRTAAEKAREGTGAAATPATEAPATQPATLDAPATPDAPSGS